MQVSRYVPALLDHLIWVILMAVFLFFMTQSPVFLSSTNITNILSAAAILGVLVVGQTFVLITGNFDLSTESTLGLAGLVGMFLIVPAAAPHWGGDIMLNPYLSILIILAMGAGVGYITGALITIGKMNNFIVTLAMLLILRGLILAFTKGTPISGLGFEPAETYFWLGHKALVEIPGVVKIPVAVVATAAVFVIGHIILNHRRFGRELYAIGGNRQAAIASGIDADARVRQVYVLSGLARRLRGLDAGGPRRLDPGQPRRGLHLHRHGGRRHRRHQPAGRARHHAGRVGRRAAALHHRPRPQPDERQRVLGEGHPGPHHHVRHVHRCPARQVPRV